LLDNLDFGCIRGNVPFQPGAVKKLIITKIEFRGKLTAFWEFGLMIMKMSFFTGAFNPHYCQFQVSLAVVFTA
jgi:hypothetical protein